MIQRNFIERPDNKSSKLSLNWNHNGKFVGGWRQMVKGIMSTDHRCLRRFSQAKLKKQYWDLTIVHTKTGHPLGLWVKKQMQLKHLSLMSAITIYILYSRGGQTQSFNPVGISVQPGLPGIPHSLKKAFFCLVGQKTQLDHSMGGLLCPPRLYRASLSAISHGTGSRNCSNWWNHWMCNNKLEKVIEGSSMDLWKMLGHL